MFAVRGAPLLPPGPLQIRVYAAVDARHTEPSSMKRDLAIAATCGFAITLATVSLAEGRLDRQAGAAGQSSGASSASAQYRAQLDQYCVT